MSTKKTNKQLLLVAEAVSNEKGVSQEVVFEAICAALESATRKQLGLDAEVKVILDKKTGEYDTFRCWEVVDDEALEFPDRQLTLEQAQKIQSDIALGGRIEEPMESESFGRIDAQTAKQVILQKVREAERNRVCESFSKRVGELIIGVVKKSHQNGATVDFGNNAEASLARQEMIPGEVFRPSDKVRAYLYEVSPQPRGPQLFISRTRPEMLIELFRIEVPEIGEEVIKIVDAARDPGSRAKISVKTNDGRIDPIGACVGMRGSRVQAVSNELAGERVDIVLWDDNPAQYVINAMAPAEVASIVVDEETKSMDLAIADEYLSQAIGRSGQNVRLASTLTGWRLNVMSVTEFNEKNEAESQDVVKKLVVQLGVDDSLAAHLVDMGITSIEELAYLPDEELEGIEGLDSEAIAELRTLASDVLLTQALTTEEALEQSEPAEDLLSLEGMDKSFAYQLASKGIVTREELAEQSIDELMEFESMTEERAGELIMKARAHWFTDEE